MQALIENSDQIVPRGIAEGELLEINAECLPVNVVPLR